MLLAELTDTHICVDPGRDSQPTTTLFVFALWKGDECPPTPDGGVPTLGDIFSAMINLLIIWPRVYCGGFSSTS